VIELLIVSFLAGVLTVFAPCILPLLPVIIGGSIARDQADQPTKSSIRPLVIALSLGLSVMIFTLLLRATTALLGIPQSVWQLTAGLIVLALGIHFLWPTLWEKFAIKLGIHNSANTFLGSTFGKTGFAGDALTGFALGPVFNSCSPTYALIVATVLPSSFALGVSYLAAYAIGLAGTLLVIAYTGQAIVKKLGWLADQSGWFRRVIGVLFIIVGLLVVFGLDRKIQVYVLQRGWYDPVSRIEQSLR
jgi:cytochrome c-type biogenesis protein